MPDVPAPESVPPVNNPDPQPNDPKPKAPPPEDETGRPVVPVELPGKPHVPERAWLEEAEGRPASFDRDAAFADQLVPLAGLRQRMDGAPSLATG